MFVTVFLCSLPFLFLLLWGIEQDRERERERKVPVLTVEPITVNPYVLRAVLNIEKKMLDRYADYSYMPYGEFVTEVVLGKIKLKD